MVVLLVAAVSLSACGASDTTDQAASERQASSAVSKERVSATLPPGWSKVEMPGIHNPDAPLFTVSSAPVSVDRPPDICHTPDDLVDQLPASGALVQVSSWAPQRLPGRPDPIALGRSTFNTYECSGPSHQLAFHQNGRGIQITAWFDPDRVDPKVRRQTVAFLNSLRVEGFPSRKCRRINGVSDLQTYAPGFEGTDGLSCRDAASVWRDWSAPDQELTPCTRTGGVHDVRIIEGKITCGVAERFVVGGVKGFAPHPGGWVERSGRFTCRIRDFSPRSNPGLFVECLTDRGTEGPRFSFRFA